MGAGVSDAALETVDEPDEAQSSAELAGVNAGIVHELADESSGHARGG